ncbi:MAG TPA: VanZ family protein [Gaiellaceae bacterium]|nr:VanZ family protein [Gaiellaceae bacterium]
MPRFVSLWLPVVAWAAVIFALSSMPNLGTGLGGWDLLLRKLAHGTEYALFGFLLLRALGRQYLAVALGIAYALTDELHQHFISGRVGAPIDLAIDALGVIVGVLVGRWWL